MMVPLLSAKYLGHNSSQNHKIKKMSRPLELRSLAREMFTASESSQPLCVEMRCEPCHQFEL